MLTESAYQSDVLFIYLWKTLPSFG